MGRHQRDKGGRGERELRDELKALGFTGAYRTAQRCGKGDTSDVGGIEGVHVECKRCEALSLYPAMEQAVIDADGQSVPVVCHRRNHKDWLLVVRLSDLRELAERIHLQSTGIDP